MLGRIGLASDDVAAAFSQAIELFARQKPRHVQEVKIVVFVQHLVDLFWNIIVQAKGESGFICCLEISIKCPNYDESFGSFQLLLWLFSLLQTQV